MSAFYLVILSERSDREDPRQQKRINLIKIFTKKSRAVSVYLVIQSGAARRAWNPIHQADNYPQPARSEDITRLRRISLLRSKNITRAIARI